MAYDEAPALASGYRLRAADWNQYIRDNLDAQEAEIATLEAGEKGIGYVELTRSGATGTQTFTVVGTGTQITGWTEDYDPDGLWASDEFTAPVNEGYHCRIHGWVWVATASGSWTARLECIGGEGAGFESGDTGTQWNTERLFPLTNSPYPNIGLVYGSSSSRQYIHVNNTLVKFDFAVEALPGEPIHLEFVPQTSGTFYLTDGKCFITTHGYYET